MLDICPGKGRGLELQVVTFSHLLGFEVGGNLVVLSGCMKFMESGSLAAFRSLSYPKWRSVSDI